MPFGSSDHGNAIFEPGTILEPGTGALSFMESNVGIDMN